MLDGEKTLLSRLEADPDLDLVDRFTYLNNSEFTPVGLGLILKRSIELAEPGDVINMPSADISVGLLYITKPINFISNDLCTITVTEGIVIDFGSEKDYHEIASF